MSGDPHRTALAGNIPEAAHPALIAHVARLKHDLGKYVALRQRWLGAGASLDERRAALADDVLCTRRGPEGTQDALSLWHELRPALVGEVELPGGWRVDLRGDPDLSALDGAMAVLREVVTGLEGGAASEELVDRGCAAAVRIADGCRSLDRRVRARNA